jgi:hypothetical protein
VDTPNLATPAAISTALPILGRIPEIHMILYHLGFHPISRWGMGRFGSSDFLGPVIESILEVRKGSGKPVLMALRPPNDLGGMQEFIAARTALVEAGVPVFHSLADAAKAMSRVVRWNRNRARAQGASPSRARPPGR